MIFAGLLLIGHLSHPHTEQVVDPVIGIIIHVHEIDGVPNVSAFDDPVESSVDLNTLVQIGKFALIGLIGKGDRNRYGV